MKSFLQSLKRDINNNRFGQIGMFTALLLTLLSVVVIAQQANTIRSNAQLAESFTFTAVGDFSNNGSTTAVLDSIPGTGSQFTLALGDLSYGGLKPETAWCDYVKSRVGNTYPFELISGNHDEDGEPAGQLLSNFASCLPDRLGGVTGTYAKEYYFNYPAANPLARFILISPGLTLDGVTYDYPAGSSRYQWVSNAIDEARASGIKWIVVGNHYNCITMATKTCEMGTDLMNLLVSKKVDLILQGHEHTYQRSKQLSHSTGCTAIVPNVYNSNCVVDDGADGSYEKNKGPVLGIVGTGGVSLYDINTSDPEAGYFAKWSGSNSNATYGLMKFTVTPSQIAAQFVRGSGGNFTDSYTIVDAGAPTPTTAPPSTSIQLIPLSSTWKYLDINTRPAGWETLAYDDATWKTGNAELGYGDGDEATVVSFGTNSSSKYTSTYFRKKFTVANAASVTGLSLNIKRDDGAVVYLNGTEVYRTNMPGGTIGHSTFSSSSIEDNAYYSTSVSPSLLRDGENVIAVEVHQSDLSSSDVSFNFFLNGTVSSGITATPVLSTTVAPSTVPTNTPVPSPTPTRVPSATPTMTPTPTTPPVSGTFIPLNSVWKYLDNNTRPTGWNTLTFNDTTWKSGAAELGYGDGDERTIVSYGTSSTNKYRTTYFRRKFTVLNPATITSLTVSIKRDDGAVVYLNGTEVYRTNMPTGTISHTTFARTSIEDNTFYSSSINKSLLRTGDNVVAVEVHQSDSSSSDVSFNLQLTGM